MTFSTSNDGRGNRLNSRVFGETFENWNQTRNVSGVIPNQPAVVGVAHSVMLLLWEPSLTLHGSTVGGKVPPVLAGQPKQWLDLQNEPDW